MSQYKPNKFNHEQKELMDQLIAKLRDNNNFGYKIVAGEQLRVLANWYTRIHGTDIVIGPENTQFFGNSSLMWTYILLGLTTQGSNILYVGALPPQINTKIMNIGRIPIQFEINSIQDPSKQFQMQVKSSKLVIFSNPDAINRRIWSESFRNKIIDICKKHSIYLVIDESIADLCHQFKTALSVQYSNLMVIRRIGSLLANERLHKHICVFGSPELKILLGQKETKSLKILPGDLTSKLIKVTMGEDALRLRSKMIDGMVPRI